jgi:hypothetical protein
MKTALFEPNDTGSNIFLTGTILFAHIDYGGLVEYALKALIGGGIWLFFKVSADRMNKNK